MKALSCVLLLCFSLSSFASSTCEMDYSTRTDNVDWEFFGPLALQQGKSIEQVNKNTFKVTLHSGEYWDESTWTYSCEDKTTYLECVMKEAGNFDLIGIVKEGKDFIVYDIDVDSDAEFRLNKKVFAVFKCD